MAVSDNFSSTGNEGPKDHGADTVSIASRVSKTVRPLKPVSNFDYGYSRLIETVTECSRPRSAQSKPSQIKKSMEFHTMNRILVPAVLAVAIVASSASNASAFGHLKSLFGGCDSGCDVACEPVCGCEPVVCCEPVCEPCCAPKMGLLQKLFSCKKNACDTGCCEIVEPVCGCEPVSCEPVCGCEPSFCEPACGCEPVCCDSKPCRPFGGLFARMFSKKSACDAGCCEIVEPTCGCEPVCGVEAACGCH